MAIDIALVGPERHEELVQPLLTAFGLPADPERAARVRRLPEVMHRVAALDQGAIVGGAGSYLFTMTTPGGSAATAGLTMVGVLPTHRRRGILTALVRRHLDEVRAARIPVAALWASEGSIYGRFGYGVASFAGRISIERDRTAFRKPVPRTGRFRLLDQPAAAAAFPGIWDRVRATTPGMLSRSAVWWDNRRIGDFETGGAPLQRVLLEIDGRPEGYAVYRFADKIFANPGPLGANLAVSEAIATSPEATAQLWRYLCDLDLVNRLEASYLPPTHPLFHLVLEPRRLRMTLEDALWVRLVDVETALGARSWRATEAVTLALEDAFCPWNAGVYRIDGGGGRRTDATPELRLDASALGSLYLGGISAPELADAGGLVELAPGAVDRADALFRSSRYPWCPEIF